MNGVLLAAALSAASPVASAPPTPLVVDAGRSDRTRPHKLVRRHRRHPAPPAAHAAAAARPEPIRTVLIEGATPPPGVMAATRPFIGKLADEATLTAMANAMSAAYDTTDIAIHGISITGADVDGGTIHVHVAEGFVESVSVDGDRRTAPLVRRYAAAMLRDHPLRRATQARVLALIARIPGTAADADFVPGTVAGGVVLKVTIRRTGFKLTAGIDNRGPVPVGAGQARMSLTAFGLLAAGDQATVSAIASTHVRRYRYLAGSYALPLGGRGLQLNLGGGGLWTHLPQMSRTGHAQTATVGLTYPVRLSDARELSVGASLDGLNSDNVLLGRWLTSERTRTARATLGLAESSGLHALSGSVTVSRGLDALGARTIEPISQPRFWKLSTLLSLDRQFGDHLVARLNGTAQYSHARLPTSETLVLGGADFGRGFDTAAINGDSGYAASGELAYVPALAGTFSGSELYGFADGGRLHLNRRGASPGTDYGLASAGAGVRAHWHGAILDLSGSRTLSRPDRAILVEAQPRWRVSFDLSFDLTR